MNNRNPKKTSQTDRSIASNRAKRDAAVNAKRGISKTKKATDMQIEQEVKKQAKKSAKTKKRNEKKAQRARPKTNQATDSRETKEDSAADAVFGGRVPSKKAIEAAVKGMKGKINQFFLAFFVLFLMNGPQPLDLVFRQGIK